MRSGSPAAETDHVWAAAAHISPLCKVAGPPMINSTGEPNEQLGGYRVSHDRGAVTAGDGAPVWPSPVPGSAATNVIGNFPV
jgi:hypothetical protein